MSLLNSDQWRALIDAARVGNAALQIVGSYQGPDLSDTIDEAFGELVRQGNIA